MSPRKRGAGIHSAISNLVPGIRTNPDFFTPSKAGIKRIDEELRSYLVALGERLARRLEVLNTALDETRHDLMGKMNNQHERLINIVNTLRTDFMDTKDFLLRDR